MIAQENRIIQGDCREALKTIPDNSVDLICTDPPYFAVKTDEWWDKQWDKPNEFLKWLDSIAVEWQRILKHNGSLYCFASPRMAARVEVMLGERFNVLNRITWQKPPFSTKAEMFVKEDLRAFFLLQSQLSSANTMALTTQPRVRLGIGLNAMTYTRKCLGVRLVSI